MSLSGVIHGDQITKCHLPDILVRETINEGNKLTVKVVSFNEMTLEIASISMTPTFWESHKMQLHSNANITGRSLFTWQIGSRKQPSDRRDP